MSNQKRPFVVGDRVSFEGYSATGKWWHGRGRITRADDIYSISIDVDGGGQTIVMPLRCLRRLVPKKRREIWVWSSSYPEVDMPLSSREWDVLPNEPERPHCYRRFIEALHKRKETK